MSDADGDACPGCERFFRTFDALVEWADRHQRVWVLIVTLATLGAGTGAIIAVAVLK